MSIIKPSDWVRRFAVAIPAQGEVVDVACGSGRHAKLLASMGYHVLAVDRDVQALASLRGITNVTTQVADLECAHWPLKDRSFAGVIVTNYLHRPHFESLLRLVQPRGVLIYETFMIGNEAFGKPSNPNFLLEPYELIDLVRTCMTVMAFEQGRVDMPKPAMMQRICAVAGEARLPHMRTT